jgi:cytochrome c-type biogenesis protein
MLSTPILNMKNNTQIPLLIVFLVGIIGSTAPCQLTTNLGAIGFISHHNNGKKTIMKSTLWYLLGKISIYLLFGIIAMLLGTQIENSSIKLFSITKKLTGPIVVFIGLYILNVIKFRFSIGNSIINKQDNFIHKFKKCNPSFILGIVFSLAFCPTLFWLFFGIVIPMSIKSSIGVLYPVIFAVGTLMPLILITILFTFGKRVHLKQIKSIKKLQNHIRMIGGFLLIAFGILDTLMYWFI